MTITTNPDHYPIPDMLMSFAMGFTMNYALCLKEWRTDYNNLDIVCDGGLLYVGIRYYTTPNMHIYSTMYMSKETHTKLSNLVGDIREERYHENKSLIAHTFKLDDGPSDHMDRIQFISDRNLMLATTLTKARVEMENHLNLVNEKVEQRKKDTDDLKQLYIGGL